MSTIDIASLVADCYVDYGRYVNWMRAIPSIDGLKPSQRRVLLATRTEAKEMTKTAGVVGEVIKRWHPHGSASVEPVVSDFVRRGLIKGQGNHGAKLLEYLPEAAPRYTEVQNKPELNDILFKLMGYAPSFENELGTTEPEYLITPIPIALLHGTSGIGVGVNTRIPAFTFKSLLAAYKADNPLLLESAYGYKIIPDKSDLHKLWTKGEGRLTLKMDVDYGWSDDDNCHVTTITGSGAIFTPRIANLDQLLDEDRVFIRNESKSKIKLVIGRTKGTRAVSDDEVFNMCEDIATYTRAYGIRVNVFNKIRTLSIKDWLDVSIGLFNSTFEKWKSDQIKSVEHKIEVYRHIPQVAALLLEDKSNEEIMKTLNISEDIVKDVLGRSLRVLRRTDFNSEISSLTDKVAELNKATSEDILNDGLSVL